MEQPLQESDGVPSDKINQPAGSNTFFRKRCLGPGPEDEEIIAGLNPTPLQGLLPAH